MVCPNFSQQDRRSYCGLCESFNPSEEKVRECMSGYRGCLIYADSKEQKGTNDSDRAIREEIFSRKLSFESPGTSRGLVEDCLSINLLKGGKY